MSMETELFWSGSFGDSYTDRNQVDHETRTEFWRSAIEFCMPQTVLEVGCNRGANLRAIQTVDPTIDCVGVDINAHAVNEARAQGVSAEIGSALEIASRYGHNSKDLVLTAGVLIHIPPDDLKRVMQQIIDVSAKYIIAVEYADEKETEVEYRGHAGKLWRRPYGELYKELGCSLLSYGKAGGFDDCRYWLLTRPGARDLAEREELF